MPGIQEILLRAVIVIGILFLPRLASRGKEMKPVRPAGRRLSGAMRLSIMLSVLWTGLTAFFCEPWEKGLIAFLVWGAGPLIAGWGGYWVLRGFRDQ